MLSGVVPVCAVVTMTGWSPLSRLQSTSGWSFEVTTELFGAITSQVPGTTLAPAGGPS